MTVQLVIGASGLVGSHLLRAAAAAGREALGTCFANPLPGLLRLDLRQPGEVRELLALRRPRIVYVPASLTNVDDCETHPAEYYAINVQGVRHLVEAANSIGARVVYFSSDYVFDGRSGPYREQDTANPLCEYGRQKLIAEHYVALHSADYLILRTTVVYGWESQGKNFLYRLLTTLRGGGVLRVPGDQVGSPTYAPDLARAAVELAERAGGGVYHVAGPERASRYEFAGEAARVFGLDPARITSVLTRDLGQAAARPLDAGMVVEKATALLSKPLMGYREGLRVMAREQGTPA